MDEEAFLSNTQNPNSKKISECDYIKNVFFCTEKPESKDK